MNEDTFNFVMHVSIDYDCIEDFDIDMARSFLEDVIHESESGRGKVTIRPLSEIIAC